MVDSKPRLKRAVLILTLVTLLTALPLPTLAQTYRFTLDELTANVFLNSDGTMSIDYVFVFSNDPGADPIDFVDVGLPNKTYRISEISADINGIPITDIEDSPYVQGIALGLGANAIPPGQTGTVHVFVPRIERVFFVDETDENYTSAQFVNTWFGSEFVSGSTDLTVNFILPPGLGPDEPRWHQAPPGFPAEPSAGFTDDGRIFYSWRNQSASPSRGYTFGASVPRQFVEASAISSPPQPGAAGSVGFDFEAIIPFLFCGGFIGFFILLSLLGTVTSQRRKLQYLPPKIAIGGHGIKRGLTAVEAGILLEQPMDKIMTMILFSILKKEAASVVSQDPLKLDIPDPIPEGLRPYEQHFLAAFQEEGKKTRRKLLQDMMIKLVNSVAKKMKGFSRRETVAYYRDIAKRAWAQVEAADTPGAKSKVFDEYMEWTMLDRDFEGKTKDVFSTGPVYVPMWWHRYDPGYSSAGGGPRAAPVPSAGRSGTPSLPTLPGSDFAVGVVGGIQNVSANVVGNITEFTSGITQKTNPPPPPSRSYGGGGSSCACACAGCACACACAGGGR